MPLVRTDVQEGRSAEDLRRLADVVQEVVLEVFAAPPRDRHQIITEHPVGHVITEDTGLGYERTDGVVVLQVVQKGRSEQQERRLHAALAERLEADCGVRPDDLVVSVTTNTREDWSFGRGRAQFLEGDLGRPQRSTSVVSKW